MPLQWRIELLGDCPHVTMLASSGEPLSIAGESLYRVPSLSVPDDATVLTLSRLGHQAAATRLMGFRYAHNRFAYPDTMLIRY